MQIINELTEYFRKLPGIGQRQARRIVLQLARTNQNENEKLAKLINDLKNHVTRCEKCNRFFESLNKESICSICSNPNRQENTLLIIGNDNDLDAIEKSSIFDGQYFVIGGLFKFNEDNNFTKSILEKILNRIKNLKNLEEIVFALSATPDGDFTSDVIKDFLKDKFTKKISKLGRGLSTGTEIEYSDEKTIKSAFLHRE